jgi:ribosome biogenesis GTPase
MNALFPGLTLRTAAISASVNKGRHTTVGAMLHPLPAGGYVADTPGLREVGLWGIPQQGVADCFPEFRPFLDGCRFGDCTHLVEPGCALREAVAGGAVRAARYDSFTTLRAELTDA